MTTPIQFKPVYQTYVWGGDRIGRLYHRPDAPAQAAESWEVSDRIEGMSVAIDAVHTGQTLAALTRDMGETLIGRRLSLSKFPLLVKLIDARESLSIQVHPQIATAQAEPKTELWVALAPSSVYAGFIPGVSETQMKSALGTAAMVDLLECIEMEVGDAVYIPAGTVHAIRAGSLLLEVQQNSNTTYRLYDWGRERALHLKEGSACIALQKKGAGKQVPKILEETPQFKRTRLVSSPYFEVERVELRGRYATPIDPSTFQIFFCQSGFSELSCDGASLSLRAGQTVLIPAAAQTLALSGNATLIQIQQGEPALEPRAR